MPNHVWSTSTESDVHKLTLFKVRVPGLGGRLPKSMQQDLLACHLRK